MQGAGTCTIQFHNRDSTLNKGIMAYQHAAEPEVGEIKRIDERIDHANRIFLLDPVVELLRQKRRLPPICPLDEPLHGHANQLACAWWSVERPRICYPGATRRGNQLISSSSKRLKRLVAGVGFEPTTFRL